MIRPPKIRIVLTALVVCVCLAPQHTWADQPAPVLTLPGTEALAKSEVPLDEIMVAGIDRHAMRAIENARQQRHQSMTDSLARRREDPDLVDRDRIRLRAMIGAVDPLVSNPRVFKISEFQSKPSGGGVQVDVFACAAMGKVTVEGLRCSVTDRPVARVIVLGDADWSPEQILDPESPLGSALGLRTLVHQLLQRRCDVYLPVIIDRQTKWSGHENVRSTNISHREWIYRMAFAAGRHIIGYEVQKVRSLCRAFREEGGRECATSVVGVGEGGLIALMSAASDDSIDSAMICGYFSRRDRVWAEPLYRNVWSQLKSFGDAELAAMIAPRKLIVEASAIPGVEDPSTVYRQSAHVPGAGEIRTPSLDTVQEEFARAKDYYRSLDAESEIRLVVSEGGTGGACSADARERFVEQFGEPPVSSRQVRLSLPETDPELRMKRQVAQLVDHSQRLLRDSWMVRDESWKSADRSSLAAWTKASDMHRQNFYDETIGRIDEPLLPPRPKTRRIMNEKAFSGYEVTLDVFGDVIAGGVLLLPADMKENEKRPVVVCQHGLEGTPADTITEDSSERAFRAYQAFSRRLAERGFIVYAPQNPYRGKRRFRVLQRKSNPLKRSLYSYIIPQHQQTLRWLATLPNVDPERIAFYGLSYGGKTAVRVPTMFTKSDDQPAYCLSICSGDFNDWIRKLTDPTYRGSYVYTGEHEIWEWNMAHTANYSELATLMTPRPFMVERGHRDGVGLDEWVASEYAKVRRHYDELGLGDKTEIEFFVGGHEINGVKSYEFLHKHLRWPPEDGRLRD